MDLDKRDFDIGLEFDRVTSSNSGSEVICDCSIIHPKGIKRVRFSVDAKTRRIVGMNDRYVCYWVPRNAGQVRIYNREYALTDGAYYHHSNEAFSRLTYDDEGYETGALNVSFTPRKYIERYVRLLDF